MMKIDKEGYKFAKKKGETVMNMAILYLKKLLFVKKERIKKDEKLKSDSLIHKTIITEGGSLDEFCYKYGIMPS